jgi:hypothetical protein
MKKEISKANNFVDSLNRVFDSAEDLRPVLKRLAKNMKFLVDNNVLSRSDRTAMALFIQNYDSEKEKITEVISKLVAIEYEEEE